ncbi:MAG TPA: CAP domain-containing protein [Steroidobacteraceae bacterium]|nr:CAP domain-containing protein [Steroidobacteraceae bacterium]
MIRRWYFALSGFLALAATSAASPPARADALSTVQMLRAGGCGGLMPIARPLGHSAWLDRAAEQWAAGNSLTAASERAGYWPQSTIGLHVSGSDWSVIQQLRHSGCSTVLDRGLREMGFYQRGPDTWLVLAAGYGMPFAARQPERTLPPPSPEVTRLPGTSQAAIGPPAGNAPASAAVVAAGSARPAQLASRALELVNEVRARGARCGGRAFGPAPPLMLSGTLGSVAFGHATDMAAHNYFEHEDLAGHSPADRVRAIGYREKLVGENIAYGPKSVEEVVQGWLDSPGHCQNIMDPRFAEMGIAFANGQSLSRRGLYWVQVLAEPRA